MEVEMRCPTEIPGFDKLCEGGLVSDAINLLIGNPGSGKTTFGVQFLFNGAMLHGESGLFITFENETEDLNRLMKSISIDVNALEKSEAKVHILKYDFKKSIKQFQNELVDLITKYDIKRVCLDPINVFALEFPEEKNIRRQIYEFLSLLKKLDVCVLISGETDENVGNDSIVPSQEISFCKYLADAVIQLYSSGLSGAGDRAVKITKMRMTNHVRGPVGMQLTKMGVKVLKR